MAENVKIGVQVDDGGSTKKLVKDAQQLHQEFAGAAKAAKSIKLPQSSAPGGTAGSRAAAGMSEGEYNKLRGSAGVTGASARDFANQAQGLGGLVRLYATYAANIFAVGAAFQALSRAMDTTNMVRGLDQLGAASGRNLGSLSKRIEELTGGAVSLREAMSVVAQSTGAGMSSKQVERLAAVAKNASQALGVSMPDALNRLSRGIVKLEPELLDELGLFTKIGPATEAYARSIGKTASQLTDFERRQAFANAVLKEGEDKFNAIALQANPYDKLIASLKNLLQVGLEFVNKFLAPVLEGLASSPTALAAAVGLVATTIVKQALPNIGQFKDSLIRSANEAKEVALKTAKDAGAARQKLDEIRQKNLDKILLEETTKVREIEENISATKLKELKRRQEIYSLFKKDASSIEQADLDAAKQRYATMEAELKVLESKRKPNKALIDARKEELKLAEEIIAAQTVGMTAYKQAEKISLDSLNNQSQGWTTVGLRIKAKELAEQKAIKSGIVANAAYYGSLVGTIGAIRLANDEIKESGIRLGMVSKATLQAKVGFAALGGQLAFLGSIANAALGWIGLIISLASVLDFAMSKAGKEIAAAESATQNLNKTSEGAARTLEYLNKNAGINSTTVDGIKAAATALIELSNNATEAFDATSKAKAAMGGWEKLKDLFFSLFGKGLDQELAKNLASSIQSGLKLAAKTGQGRDSEQRIKELLGITTLDTKSITQALTDLSRAGNLEPVVKEFEKLKNSVGDSLVRVDGFKTALANTKLTFEQFIQSTANNDPMFKLGVSLQTLGSSLSKALSGTKEEISSLFIELQSNPLVASLLGGEVISAVVDLKDFKEFTAQVQQYSESEKAITDELTAQQDEYEKLIKLKERDGVLIDSDQKRLDKLKDTIDDLAQQKNIIDIGISLLDTDKFTKAKQALESGLANSFIEGAKYIAQGLKNAAEQAGLTIAKARAGVLTGEAKAAEDLRLRNEEISLRIRNIDTTVSLILSNQELTAAIEEATAIENYNKDRSSDMAKATLEAAQVYRSIVKSGTLAQQGRQLDKTTIEGIVKEFGSKLSELGKNFLANRLLGLSGVVSPQMAARRQEAGNLAASNITGEQQLQQARLQDIQKLNDLAQRRVASTKELLNIYSSLVGFQTTESLLAIQTLESIQLQAAQTKELQTINLSIEQTEKALANATDAKSINNFKNNLLILQEQKLLITNAQLAETQAAAIKQQVDRVNQKIETINKENQLLTAQNALVAARATAELEISQQRETSAANYLGMSQTFLNNLQYQQTVEKAILDQQTAAAAARLQYAQQEQIARERISAILASDTGSDETGPSNAAKDRIAAVNAELERQKQLRDVGIKQLEVQANKTIAIAGQTYTISQAQEELNLRIQSANNFAEGLKGIFGSIGEVIGGLAVIIEENAQAQEKSAAAVAKARSAYETELNAAAEGIDRTKELKAAKLALSKEEQKADKTKLNNELKLISASKKMFSEKTAAYKVITAVEKAYYAFKMASEIKLQMESAITASKQIMDAIKGMTAKGGEGIIQQLTGGDVYTAIPRAAAVAAFVASIISAFGGGSAPNVSGVTAAQRQETQGSAMGYDAQGNLTQVRRGVFGDVEAKSESIANSLEIIKANSVAGLSYDNRMLKALEAIRNSLDTTAKQLFRIPGLKSGSLSGTQEGTSSSGIKGLFGSTTSTEIVDSGIKLAGTFREIANAGKESIKGYEVVEKTRKSSGFLGIGGKTSTSVDTILTDLPLQARKAIASAFEYGETLLIGVATFLGQNAEEASRKLGEVKVDELLSLRGLSGEEFTKALNNVFGAILDDAAYALFDNLEEFANFGEGMLETVIRVTDSNKKVLQAVSNTLNTDIEASLRVIGVQVPNVVREAGLGIKELSTELNTVITGWATMSQDESSWTEAIYAQVSEVQQALGFVGQILGEEVLAQIDNDLSNLSQDQLQTLKDAGATFIESVTTQIADGLTTSFDEKDIKLASIRITEALVEGAGGLDKFLEQSEFFAETFLTEAERLAPVQKAVTTRMAELGYASVDTREEFKQLVQSIDLTTEGGRELYQNLMDVAEGFAEVYDSSTNVEELITNAGLGISNFADILYRVMTGEIKAEDIGKTVGNTIRQGVLKAISQSFLNNIATTITTNLITPVITSVVQGTSVAAALTALSFETAIEYMIAQAEALATLFENPDFQIWVGRLVNSVTQGFTAFASILGPNGFGFTVTKIDEYKTKLADLNKTLDARKLEYRVRVLEEEIEALEDTKQPYKDRIKLLEADKEALQDQIEVLQNLKRPLEQYVQSLEDSKRPLLAQIKAYEQLKRPLEQQIRALNLLKKPLEEQIKALEKQKRPIEQQIKALNKLKDAVQDQIDAVNLRIDALNDEKDAVNRLLEAEQDRNSQLRDQVGALESSIDKFKNFSKSLKDFRDSLLLGELSPGTPAQRYTLAQQNLQDLYTRAMTGDEAAISDFQSAASSFLDLSREYYASSDMYTQDFTSVQTMLDSVISMADTRVSQEDATLASLKQLLTSSDTLISGYTATIKSLDAQIEAYGLQIEAFNTQLTSYDTSIDALNDQIGLIDDSIDLVNQDIQLIDDQIDVITTQIEAIDAQIVLVNDQIQLIDDQIQTVRDQINLIDRSITSINDQIGLIDRLIANENEAIALIDGQIATVRETISGLQAVKKSSEDLAIEISSLETEIVNLTNALTGQEQEAYDSIVRGFSSLDKNTDSLLTLQELKTSGLASDDTLTELFTTMDLNGDGQLTRLEAIQFATQGTYYQLQDITAVLTALSTGSITTSQAQGAITSMNTANTATGGTAITNVAPTATSAGLVNGVVTPSLTDQYSQALDALYTRYFGAGYSDPAGKRWWTQQLLAGTYVNLTTLEDKWLEAYFRDMYTRGGLTESVVTNYMNVIKSLYGEIERTGFSETDRSKIDPDGFKYWMDQLVSGSWTVDTIGGPFRDSARASGYSYAKGASYLAFDQMAQVHEGERIIPAADNEVLTRTLVNRQETDKELINEIRRLNQKIDSLERTVAEGAVMNAQATNRNTDEISKTVKDVNVTTKHKDDLRRRTSVV